MVRSGEREEESSDFDLELGEAAHTRCTTKCETDDSRKTPETRQSRESAKRTHFTRGYWTGHTMQKARTNGPGLQLGGGEGI